MPGNDADLAHLAQDLKRYCGAGGTVRNGIIELQGEHREKLRTYLIRLGYRVKVAGG
jgi:translation initiation factor 1